MMGDLRRHAQYAASSSDDDGTHGGGKEEGKRTFPPSKGMYFSLTITSYAFRKS